MKFVFCLLILFCIIFPILNIGSDGFKAKTEKDRMTATYKDKGAFIKLTGFDNIDVRYKRKPKQKKLYRKTIDKDTEIVILKPKPIIVMPQFIIP